METNFIITFSVLGGILFLLLVLSIFLFGTKKGRAWTDKTNSKIILGWKKFKMKHPRWYKVLSVLGILFLAIGYRPRGGRGGRRF